MSREYDDCGRSRIIDGHETTAAWSGTSWAETGAGSVQAVRDTRAAG